jgi:dipeptidyl aminopeptidase/acylaminoacyl peptidase
MSLPALIPRTVLFGNPERAMPQLSPDGKRIAYLAPDEGVLNVWVGPVDGPFKPVTRDRDRGIRQYFWAYDGVHLLYLQDQGGDENWRLFAVEPDRGVTRELTPFDGVQTQLLAHEKQSPSELIVALNREDPTLHDAYHLDLVTGTLTLVAKNPGTVSDWIADHDLKVRAAVATREDGGTDLLWRGKSDWSVLISWQPADALASGAVGFSADNRSLLLRDSRDVNAARLVSLDPTSKAVTTIASDPEYDVDAIVRNPDTHEIEMVSFVRARREWQILQPALAADVAAAAQVDKGEWSLADRDSADKQWLLLFEKDDGPAAYYRFDRRTRKATFMFHTRPALNHYTLAPMQPISFTSRDGLTIHGYLTLPVGVEPRGLPLVLNVHGGPWARDLWGYDPEAQWLANRGYACLQVNYRGSTGYGKRFLNAGDKEWGAKMQDDLTDAVRWAIASGVADPARVAIYGGSYGGYAALAGATFTSDLFRCAVAIVGPSNLITFIATIPPYWESFRAMLHQRVGNPETEADFLVQRSPLTHVDKIRIPMLIAQGANDPRVKQSESEQIVAAMAKAGIEHEYMLFPDEGHGFAKPENRLRFYVAAERFLARHLGGRAEPESKSA